MERSLISELQEKPNLLLLLIAAITTGVLFLNGYGLQHGITSVLPHLFYIPIVLTAYFFPRRGILFSAFVSFVYCSLAFAASPVFPGDLPAAVGRSVMFVLIAAAVSFLTTRLQESEMQFRGVAERSSDIILITDLTGRARYISPSIRKAAGWDPAEIVGNRPGGFIHPDDLGMVMEAIPALVQGTTSGAIVVRFRRKDGSYATMEFSGAPVLQDGTITGIQVIGRDVTERQRLEEAYRETSRRFAEIIDFLPDPTMVVDREGIVVAWNRAMEEMSGIPAVQVLGKGHTMYTSWLADPAGPILVDYVLRHDMDGIRAAYPQFHFEGNTVRTEKVITRTDGTRFTLWISATPLVDPDGKITGAVESLRDVSHQKKIARELRESRQILEGVINTIPVRVFWKDTGLTYLGCNVMFARDAGFERPADVIGKDDYAMVWQEQAERYRADDRAVIESGQPKLLIEEPQTTPEGVNYLLTSKVPLKDAAGKVVGVLGTYLDITERKRAEEALRQANRKLNLLSGITRHDIRNQLLALESYLEISKDSLGDQVRTADFIEKELKIARTIEHQISFTRDYEDLGVKAPAWQNVSGIIREVCTRLPLRDIRVDTGNPDLEIFADPLLEKVFYNLIDNAIRYGGEQLDTIRVTCREEGGILILAVEDNGAGIPEGDKPQLFTRGFGRHTGLGLYLSREILAITGISIRETGTPGKGARFEMAVPHGAFRYHG